MNVLRDVRLAVRYLLKAKGYSFAAILTLALVLCANTAIFSTVHAVLLEPHSIQQPERLVICWKKDRAQNLPVVELSHRAFEQWAAYAHSFSRAAAIGSSTWPTVLDEPDGSARLSSAGVTASFFETLGAAPTIGRTFRPEDDRPGARRVVVLSHGMWIGRFGKDPQVTGRLIQLDGQPHEIVGVMPAGFDFPLGTDVWTPVVPILAGSGRKWNVDALKDVGVLFVVGRLRDGFTVEMATDELDRLEAQGSGAAAAVTPFLDFSLGPVRRALWTLFAAVTLLLLIGCANVSGLMLTRVSLRRREDAVRRALGASRGTLTRYWMVEALILSVAGGTVGVMASPWLISAVVALAPQDVPRLADVSLNVTVVAFAFASMFAAALVCSLGPVRHATETDLLEELNDGPHATTSPRSYRTRTLLLVAQISLTVALLVAAGLVMRSFDNIRRIDLGFVPASVLTLHVTPRNPQPSENAWVNDLLSRVEALPDVEAAGAVSLRPLALGPIGQETSVVLEGQSNTARAARQNPTLNYQVATPGYFSAMRIPIKIGRVFDTADRVESPRVALVSEATARHLWPGQDPIGKRLSMPAAGSGWRTVVGVVADVRYRGIDDLRLDVYDAALQSPVTAADLVIRTSGDPIHLAAAVQAAARHLDPRVVVDRLTTMDAIVSRAAAPWRFSAWMFTLFATVAGTLAIVGLLSIVSLDVAQRRREFAIRLALGAPRREVLASVLLTAARRALAGIAFGVLMAAAGTRTIRSILFGVSVLDPGTYAVVAATVISAVLAASYLPARTAARTNPLTLLRRG